MSLLVLDTSTEQVLAAVVAPDGTLQAERTSLGALAHTERLSPQIVAALGEARLDPSGITGVVVGLGPGPFTGLRVGIATAAAFADAVGVPAYGVCSLDGVPVGAGEALVASDARRREVYWATYRDGVRTDGPAVDKPDALVEALGDRRFDSVVLAGAERYADVLGPLGGSVSSAYPSAVRLAAARGEAGSLTPLYLRRPDAVAAAAVAKSTVQPRSDELRTR